MPDRTEIVLFLYYNRRWCHRQKSSRFRQKSSRLFLCLRQSGKKVVASGKKVVASTPHSKYPFYSYTRHIAYTEQKYIEKIMLQDEASLRETDRPVIQLKQKSRIPFLPILQLH